VYLGLKHLPWHLIVPPIACS